MAYIPGHSLQERIDQTGPLEVREILRIGMQTAAGLAAAHAQGLVHRDIKPANILLENGVERVRITDFGLARAMDEASQTQSGVLAGTPQYMAPEQASGEAIDYRTDLFSLGSVLYAMCTGHSPFRAETTVAVLRRICDGSPRPVREVNSGRSRVDGGDHRQALIKTAERTLRFGRGSRRGCWRSTWLRFSSRIGARSHGQWKRAGVWGGIAAVLAAAVLLVAQRFDGEGESGKEAGERAAARENARTGNSTAADSTPADNIRAEARAQRAARSSAAPVDAIQAELFALDQELSRLEQAMYGNGHGVWPRDPLRK